MALEKWQLEERFRNDYLKDHEYFKLIEKNHHWAVTGIGTGFICSLLGAIVGEPEVLGYSGFVIGAVADYFMRKAFYDELEKFQQGRSKYNGWHIDD